MTEAEFHQRVDHTLERLEALVEDAADAADADVDADEAGGVLTLTFENGSSMILSRQSATRQLWLAARSGGYHFELDAADIWRCTRSGRSFGDLMADSLQSQAGLDVSGLDA